MAQAARPLLPATAPFAPEHIQALNAVMATTTAEQRSWLAGFLAGYASATGAAAPAAAPAARAKVPLTILYATQSGNAEALADQARKLAQRQGFQPKLVDAGEVTPADLVGVKNLLVVAATWGEGDPPERAVAFHRDLMSDGAPRLEGVRYSVLALGDSAYVNFCSIGRQIDERLAALGATRAAPRVECDLDYHAPAEAWTKAALEALAPAEPAGAAEGAQVIHVDFAQPPARETWTAAKPYPAEVTGLLNLASSRSSKETWHLELSLEGSGIAYEPGDALGIVPTNDPAVVEAVLEAARLDGSGGLAERLTRELEITTLTRPVLERYAALVKAPALAELVAGEGWKSFVETHRLVDLLRLFPADLTAESLAGILRKLPPRLYSIASSQKAHEDAVHLTVGLVRWQAGDGERFGVTSGQVGRRLKTGQQLPVYVQANRHFRLPADGERPIVMVGAGTGVAPFRGFVQERRATEAKGKSWLVFGERSFTHDFLYQLEWQEALDEGALTRVDLAFSRDQPEKRYVQHALWDERDELLGWLDDGAHLYVCGAMAMGRDVEATLQRIAKEAGRDPEAWLAELRREHRYQRDVY